MSFFDKASLITIPTAYKVGKLYSVKPTSGDFTFVRSTSATRVNSDGLIEKARENLLLQSNTFNTTWTTSQASLTGGQTGYDGSNDAWKIVATAANSVHRIVSNAVTGNSIQTFSVYAKAAEYDHIRIVENSSTGDFVTFDLTNGLVKNNTGITDSAFIVSEGNGWYRCGFSVDTSATSRMDIYVMQDASTLVYLGDDVSGIYIQDAQLEAGLVATDYIETTTSTVATGIVENVPRIDYSSGTPSLLLEPQRTNKITNSEYINTTTFSLTNLVTINNNYSTSPDGLDNAAKIVADALSGYHQLRTTLATPSGTDMVSCFVKASGYNYVQLTSWSTPANYVNFDLTNGSIGSVGSTPPTNYGIEDYGNGWYRIYANVQASGGGVIGIGIVTSASAGWAQSFTGNGTDGLLIWGVQIEEGSYPTSYIPTYGTSVTRTNEFGIITDTLGKGLITATEFTLFIDLNTESLIRDSSIVNFLLGDVAANGIFIYNNYFNAMNGIVYLKDSSITETVSFNTSQTKICVKVQPNNVKVFVNGIYVYTFTSLNFDFTANSNLVLQSGSRRQIVNKLLFFPTALTDAECITLTTI